LAAINPEGYRSEFLVNATIRLVKTQGSTAHMQVTTRTVLRPAAALLASAAILLGGCNDTPTAKAPPAQELGETFRDFGNYEVHFNALRTDALTPDIARSYGIQRSTNRVMLNVTVLRKEADKAPRKPVNATVQADAYNLNGQLKNLEMRRVSEGDAIYYIGETSIAGAEILVFDINVTPEGESRPLEVKLKREFDAG
jgi:Domain of unknown function (DUF4426)